MRFFPSFGLISALAFMASGVVVQASEKGAALETAGLQPGDLVTTLTLPGVVIENITGDSQNCVTKGDTILSWEHLPGPENLSTHTPNSPTFLDWKWFETEYSSREIIILTVEHGRSLHRCIRLPGTWIATVRPRLTEDALRRYSETKMPESKGGSPRTLDMWAHLLDRGEEQGDWSLAVWCYLQMAERKPGFSGSFTLIRDRRARLSAFILVADTFRKDGRLQEAEAAYRSARALANSLPDSRVTTATISYLLGSTLRQRGDLNAAQQSLDTAHAELWRFAPSSREEALALNELAILARESGNLQLARERADDALRILQRLDPDSIEASSILTNLGSIALYADDLSHAKTFYFRALDIQRKLEPGGRDAAATLNGLGMVAGRQGYQDKAEHYQKSALEILRKLDPNGTATAQVVANLGAQAFERGDFLQARQLYNEALSMQPSMATRARTLSNLGVLESRKGDLQKAYELYTQALDINQRLTPKSISTATNLVNLGTIAQKQGKIENAWELYQRALAIFEVTSPGGPNLVTTLSNLGTIAQERGEIDVAADYLGRALKRAESLSGFNTHSILVNLGLLASSQGQLTLAEKYFTASLDRAKADDEKILTSLHNLGNLAARLGQTDKALHYYHAALEIAQRFAPDSLDTAAELNSLGIVAAQAGDWQTALGQHLQVLAILERLAPDSIRMASTLHSIARAQYKLGRLDQASLHLERAIHSLEAQIERLGGSSDTRGNFRAIYGYFYLDFVDLLVQQGRYQEALEMSERSKSREFASMLRERDVFDSAQIPSALNKKRKSLAASYDRIQAEIESWRDVKDHSKLEKLVAERQKIFREQEEVVEEIHQISGNFAASRYPKPFTEKDIQGALDPGTLALFFSVGDDAINVFAVDGEGLRETYVVPCKEATLREEILIFRRLLEEAHPSYSTNGPRLSQIQAIASHLYSTLLNPISRELEGAKKILIIPDGPLHFLPWGALIHNPPGTEATRQYLIEWKPIHVASSAAMYAQALRRRAQRDESESPNSLVAFGDPIYSGGSLRGDESGQRDQMRIRRGLSALPASRFEVESILGVFQKGAKAYLGADATEEHAKSLSRDTRIIHFATHATLDERFPLNSAIVLSIPEKFEEGKDNGFLQAWEIFDQVRIDADLVVLSACESGLGKEMGGEGLIGLTRAFQYAGARSVMASLWKISDRTTAELMVRFYKHLKAGLPKDEALRAAQMELIQGPIRIKNEKGEEEVIDASAPYYWAAFQIYGDWQ